jgi:von Willebrand factor type A domain
MSDDSPDSGFDRGRSVLRAVRRRLKWVEIETHLIRADLAQFEAVHEAGIAEVLRDELDRDAPPVAADLPAPDQAGPAAAPTKVIRVDLSPRRQKAPPADNPELDYSAIPLRVDGNAEHLGQRSFFMRWAPSAWLASVFVHFGLLAVCGSLTYAIFVDETPPSSITVDLATDADHVINEAAPPEVVELAEADSPELATGDGPMNLADVPIAEPLPFTADANAAPVEGVGELNLAPTNSGTLMAGLGTEGTPGVATAGLGGGSREGVPGGRGHGGKAGRRAKAANNTSFFGTEAVGDRIVFLVDNSGSMKQGRMETTVMELLRSIDAMTKEQSFYIVFYSDEAYPMFYPRNEMHFAAATPENKQRLVPWLQTLELCSGGKLVEAIELAAPLHPDVVFILSDGDINSPRTMQRMTEANDWQFAIHTLGMGVKKPAHAENLAAIAAAHHGTFQMVQASAAAAQYARQHPIKSNPTGVAWGMGAAAWKP